MHKFNLTLHYRPGKQINFSDALIPSGHELNGDPRITGLKLVIHSLSQEVDATATHLQDIRDATERESTLQDLIQFVLVG